jgi:trans-aconitate methyltransferase
VTFNVPADAYAQFMGRYSAPLAVEFVRLVDPDEGQVALDVGCGPGALTVLLVERLGPDAVRAIDPSEPFVAAARARFPDVDVRQGAVEALPYADDGFDLVLAQLVVHFMADPLAGVREMRRVTRSGGLVAASVWDYERDLAPISVFWRAVREMDPSAPGESHLAGARKGQLVELFAAAGLADVRQTVLTIRVGFSGFDEWWQPFTLGVGPAGRYLAERDPAQQAELEQRCAALMPSTPFELEACAWAATGRA